MESDRWYTFELDEQWIGKRVKEIEQSIRMIIPDAEIFVPIHETIQDGAIVSTVLYEGYVFIKDGNYDPGKLLRAACIAKILPRFVNGKATPAVFTQKGIDEFRQLLHDLVCAPIQVGETVQIFAGTYENMSGKILSYDDDNVTVELEGIKSKRVSITVPRTFVRSIANSIDG